MPKVSDYNHPVWFQFSGKTTDGRLLLAFQKNEIDSRAVVLGVDGNVFDISLNNVLFAYTMPGFPKEYYDYGYVYICQNSSGKVKIGTTLDIDRRLTEHQVIDIDRNLIWHQRTPEYRIVDIMVRSLLSEYRINGKRDWFTCSVNHSKMITERVIKSVILLKEIGDGNYG